MQASQPSPASFSLKISIDNSLGKEEEEANREWLYSPVQARFELRDPIISVTVAAETSPRRRRFCSQNAISFSMRAAPYASSRCL